MSSRAVKLDAAAPREHASTTRTLVPMPTPTLRLQFEPYVDSEVAGNFLGFRAKTVERKAKRGELPAHPFGSGPRKRWRFLLSELDAFVRARVISQGHPCRVETGDHNV